MSDVVVVVGPGQIGQAIARRVSSRDAVHALVEKATGLGDVTGLVHAAGVSPSQASPEMILRVAAVSTVRSGVVGVIVG